MREDENAHGGYVDRPAERGSPTIRRSPGSSCTCVSTVGERWVYLARKGGLVPATNRGEQR